ncbi:unnamed protein product [Trichogramma brassicae]|uniref:Uncharacterized protein n=1 Tax=Trichogramma brassicae TaxID=86971 RepID=A0A6H5IUV8_9HYME|nr:unnamed protein product [Trichogramma brassicae]
MQSRRVSIEREGQSDCCVCCSPGRLRLSASLYATADWPRDHTAALPHRSGQATTTLTVQRHSTHVLIPAMRLVVQRGQSAPMRSARCRRQHTHSDALFTAYRRCGTRQSHSSSHTHAYARDPAVASTNNLDKNLKLTPNLRRLDVGSAPLLNYNLALVRASMVYVPAGCGLMPTSGRWSSMLVLSCTGSYKPDWANCFTGELRHEHANLHTGPSGRTCLTGDFHEHVHTGETSTILYRHWSLHIEKIPAEANPRSTPIRQTTQLQSPFIASEINVKPSDTQTVKIPARTRELVQLKLVATTLRDGYLPRIDTGHPDVFLGENLIRNDGNTCRVYAINSADRDVEFEIRPAEIHPFDYVVQDFESDDSTESEVQPITDLEQRANWIREIADLRTLNPEEKETILGLIHDYPDLFLVPGDPLPCTNLVYHEIPLENDIPINTKQYRHPPVHKEVVKRDIEKRLQEGIRIIGQSHELPYLYSAEEAWSGRHPQVASSY